MSNKWIDVEGLFISAEKKELIRERASALRRADALREEGGIVEFDWIDHLILAIDQTFPPDPDPIEVGSRVNAPVLGTFGKTYPALATVRAMWTEPDGAEVAAVIVDDLKHQGAQGARVFLARDLKLVEQS